jgi:hypothetical protein
MEPTYLPFPSENTPATREPLSAEASSPPKPIPVTFDKTDNALTQKTAIGAVIVVISIVAVLLIASVTFYFTTDPWEKNDYAQSQATINRNYFKEQFAYYAYSPTHQTPYLLLHIYAPMGNLHLVPWTVMNWSGKTTREKKDELLSISPVFEIKFQMLGEMIGLSRLRKRGVCVSSYEVLERWKREQFFPSLEKEEVEWSQFGLPHFAKQQILLRSMDIQMPIAMISCLYQSTPHQNSDIRVQTLCKVISAEIHQNNSTISLFFVPCLESQETLLFFNNLMDEKMNPSPPVSGSGEVPFRCFQLEAYFYNPEWASTVFHNLQEKIYAWEV